MKHFKPAGININTIASMIPLTTDLGDERAVLDVFRNIALTDGTTFKDIYANLDFIVETARVQRRYETVRDAATGAAMFAGLFALFFLIPDDAMAATLNGGDWGSVGLRFVAFLSCLLISVGLVAAVIWFQFPARLNDDPQDKHETPETRARKGGV